jgi:hypothetical protein
MKLRSILCLDESHPLALFVFPFRSVLFFFFLRSFLWVLLAFWSTTRTILSFLSFFHTIPGAEGQGLKLLQNQNRLMLGSILI